MSNDAASHIGEERIIQLIADGIGLLPNERDHLENCGYCRDAMTDLQGDLDRLRRQAAAVTPMPEKRFVLPSDAADRQPFRRWPRGWTVAGTALSAALLAVFIWVGGKTFLPGSPHTAPPLATLEDPEITAINMLAENALPEVYLVLSESLDGGYDEGFIDFLIPSLENDPVS